MAKIPIDLSSKTIEKFLDVVSQGLGAVYKPLAMRLEADASAYAIPKIAEAEAKADLIKAETKMEIAERAKKRLIFEEIRKQENIEAVVEKAARLLPETVSQEPVDPDWSVRFFNKVKNISNGQVQEIWAKILAGETAKPGQISVRTLEVLSNLSSDEANLFKKFCAMSFSGEQIFKLKNEDVEFEKQGLKYYDVMRLRTAGLIHEGDGIAYKLKDPVQVLRFNYSGISVLMKPKGNGVIQIPTLPFSTAGEELYHVVGASPNEEYLNDLKTAWSDRIDFTITKA